MKMTRQHFEMIAGVVKTIPDPDIRKSTALNFTVKLHESNVRFDTCRFLQACDVNDSDNNTVMEVLRRDEAPLVNMWENESSKKENFIAP
tara:strand:- start:642 stop:911 length:270 start_codon:yes stop_codon:yes gene_type:complete